MFKGIIAKTITALTEVMHFILSVFVDEKILLKWKPIHFCWWFEKNGFEVPEYFIAGFNPPTVVTTAATNIGTTTARLNGNVTDQGDAAVSSRGFAYSSSDTTPTKNEGGAVTTVTEGGTGIGVYYYDVSSLNPGTTYYFQAWATNSKGTAHGGVLTFKTGLGISKSDTITLSENVSAEIYPKTISKSDTITISESVSGNIYPKLPIPISKSDTITLSESLSHYTDQIDIHDKATVEIESLGPSTPNINKSETINLTDTPSVSVQATTTPTIDVSDTVTLTDEPTVSIQTTFTPTISVSDTLTLSENVDVPDIMNPSTSDTITLTDDGTVSIQATTTPQIDVDDTITLTDSPTASVQATTTPTISVSDTLTLTDEGTASIQATSTPTIDVDDTITLSENIGIDDIANPSTSDTITLADTGTVSIQATTTLEISISDTITLSDSGSADLPASELDISIAGTTVFSDDFDRSDSDSLGGNWTEPAGDFDINSNTCYSTTESSIAVNSTTSSGSANYTITCRGKASVDSGALGIIARYTDTTHFYLLQADMLGNAIQIYKNNGGWGLLDQGSFTLNVDTYYTFKFELNGSSLKAYANDTLIAEADDSDLTSAGSVGFRNGGGANTYNYDDLVVTSGTVESITLTDSPTVSVQATSTPTIDVDDTITLSDSPTVSVSGLVTPSPSVADTITLTDSPTISVQATATPEIDVSETITLTDEPTASVQATTTPTIDVSDTITLTDDGSASISATATPEINVSDTITLTDVDNEVIPEAGLVQASASDNISLSESVDIGDTPNIDVSDTITLADSPQVSIQATVTPVIDVDDSITLSDEPTVSVQSTTTPTIDVDETITLSDSPTVYFEGSDLVINVNETINLTDSPNISVRPASQLYITRTKHKGEQIGVEVSDYLQLPSGVGFLLVQGIGGNNEAAGVEFIAGRTGNVDEVILYTDKIGSPADGLYLEIRENSPTGSLLGTSETQTNIPQFSYCSFFFSTSVSLTQGNTYAILVYRSGSRDVSNYWHVAIGTSGDADYSRWKLDNSSWTETASAGLTFYLRGNEAQLYIEVTPEFSVSDSITLTDSPSVSIQPAVTSEVNVSETITLTENTSISIEDAEDVETSVTDTITITEDVSVYISIEPTINVSDNIILSEVISVDGIPNISESDSITITENVSAVVPLGISVSETISLADTVGFDCAYESQESENIIITDSASALVYPLWFTGTDPDSAWKVESTISTSWSSGGGVDTAYKSEDDIDTTWITESDMDTAWSS